MRSSWLPVACCALIFALVPSIAWAQATPAGQWTGRYAFPLLVGDGLLLVALGFLFAAPGWNRLGLALWILAVSAGGGLVVYGMPNAAMGPAWQGPAMIVGFALFAVAAEQARKRLAGAR